MKILILGHGRHGKDTVAEILEQKFGLTHLSSSAVACVDVVFPKLKDKYGYSSEPYCFEDRHNHRQEWFDLISEFCQQDPARLTKRILNRADMYVGMRCFREYLASRWLFDLVIWVDASLRLPEDPTMTIPKPRDAVVIDNNGDLKQLKANCMALLTKTLLGHRLVA